jgi:hypothetical protein
MVRNSSFSKTTVKDYMHEGSIDNLCNKEIADIFNQRLKCFKNISATEQADKMMKHVTNI